MTIADRVCAIDHDPTSTCSGCRPSSSRTTRSRRNILGRYGLDAAGADRRPFANAERSPCCAPNGCSCAGHGPPMPRRSPPGATIPRSRRYQDWVTPYPLERAQELIADDLAAPDGPRDGEWWMLTIADADDSTVFGDLVVHLSQGGRTAEIGYTLDRKAWGHGYANEATEALVALPLRHGRCHPGRRGPAPRQHGVGDGPRTGRTAVGGPHAPVVLARATTTPTTGSTA